MKVSLKSRLKRFLVFLFTLSVLGCTKKIPNASSSPKQPLRLNFSYVTTISSLNPHDLVLTPCKQTLAKAIFEGLTRLDRNGIPKLAAAKQIKVSEDGTQYSITLRSHCYCDGTQVVAQDFASSWRRALFPQSNCSRTELLYCIKNAKEAKKGICSIEEVGIKAVDQKTLLVELNYPTPYFLEILSLPIFFPFKENNGKILTNGPFLVEAQERNQLILRRNPLFWAKEDILTEKIEISMVEDETTALHLYEQGNFDFIGGTLSYLPVDTLSFLRKRGDFHEQAILRPCFIYLNSHVFPLSSPAIRRALSSSIERDLINKYILPGSEKLDQILPNALSQYKIRDPFQDPIAEFEMGLKELGLNRATFPPLILTSSTVPLLKKVAEYLKERWEEVFGIQVELDLYEWSSFISKIQKGEYQIGGSFYSMDYSDPLDLLLAFASPISLCKWENDSFKEIVSQIETSPKEKRKELILQSERILAKETPAIPIANECIFYLCNPHSRGWIFSHSGVLDISRVHFE